uniref:ZZtype zinc fingercontaining protein 3like [Megachile rotundata] n=1 Tax=Lepeophtheirus salmonis TaxID=72036 RepID=A0A0K2T3X7_LEPSM
MSINGEGRELDLMPPNEDVPISQVLDCSYPKSDSPQESFSFETDHEALRSNKDYSTLLKTLAILESQKSQAIKDTELLFEAQKEGLSDPLSIVKRLQSGETWPNIPGKQIVADIPDIQWEKYKIPNSVASKKPETRNGQNTQKGDKTSDGIILVRGRPFDDKKPRTFNQPWTAEEQKRLEELLIEFPSEDVEMERWKKIANALGNRTPIQVQSRIQKYFLKLHKAGLPIPGRLTKSKIRFYKPSSRFQRRNFSKNSTFFPNHNPTVKMNEDEDESMREDDIYYNRPQEEEDEEEDDVEDTDEKLKSSPKYKELTLLRKVRREIESELREGSYVHLGYRCDGCNVEPILGCRWHCTECSNKEVDFCNKCALTIPEIIPHHPKTHKLRPIRLKKKLEGFVDKDYVSNSGNLNYLDTNFMR